MALGMWDVRAIVYRRASTERGSRAAPVQGAGQCIHEPNALER